VRHPKQIVKVKVECQLYSEDMLRIKK